MDDSSDDANVEDSNLERTRLSRSAPDTPEQYKPATTVKLWKRALQKLHSIDLDPWLDFPTHDIPVETAVRHRYSVIKKKWVIDEIHVKMESNPFDRGAMRECFRLKKLPQTGTHANDWHYASNYVVKRYISNVDRQVYFDDVRLQMEAKLWAEAFNRQAPPKKVDIFQLSVIEMKSSESTDANSTRIFHIERFMEGEYRKYNSNSGFVDEQLRNTPQAFSHFTFERSGHRLLVVDIQGVGDLYTDPQIHTSDGVGYSDGNLGPRGMALFFHSHRCNPLCEYLGLTKFDLSPTELATQMPHPHKQVEGDAHHSPKEGSTDEVKDSAFPDIEASGAKQQPQLELSPDVVNAIKAQRRALNPGPRRRSVSFNQFGPTVARSTEHIQLPTTVDLRRRCDSCSTSSTWLHLNPADLLFDRGSPAHSLGSETPSLTPLKLDTDVPHSRIPPAMADVHGTAGVNNCEYSPKPLLCADAIDRTQQPRNRVASGDSGYSCRINFYGPYGFSDVELCVPKSNDVFFPHCMPDSVMHMVAGSTPSLLDPLMSPCALHSVRGTFDLPCGVSTHCNGREDYITGHPHFSTNWNHGVYHGPCGRLMNGGLHLRRHRNLSESSDLDVEEDRRMANNLLHQLMHESHKPSCADHPTNLDQEIGQSILGQIHHELARLHEAGRFLRGRKGGWSHAGLGGLLLRNRAADTDSDADSPHAEKQCVSPTCCTDTSIDWTAVLFHERHAAQLGCLEAMIVMAHYYLGLPTQLLLDCPIKPDQNDLRFGVDYLWRAAEGGDRRCMILLAHYLDVSASLYMPEPKPSKYTCPDGALLLPALRTVRPEARPSITPDAWSEAITWYQKAVDSANASSSRDGAPDEGLDAEGRYDAAEDLLPVYKILARMADMYTIGGFGLKQDYNLAGELYNQAGELASVAREGRLAAKYFELGEEAYNHLD